MEDWQQYYSRMAQQQQSGMGQGHQWDYGQALSNNYYPSKIISIPQPAIEQPNKKLLLLEEPNEITCI